jgi:transcriptional regulator
MTKTKREKLAEQVGQLAYVENLKKPTIVSRLQLGHTDIEEFKGVDQYKVCALLLEDYMNVMIEEYKSLPKKEKTQKAKNKIVAFLRNKVKLSYQKISKLTGISLKEVYKVYTVYPALAKLESELSTDPNLKIEEKQKTPLSKRTMEMIQMNKQGYSMSEIGAKFGVTRQNISKIFKTINYVPIPANTERKNVISNKKLLDESTQAIIASLKNQTRDIGVQYATYKMNTKRQLASFRADIILMYLDNPTLERYPMFRNRVKELRAYINSDTVDPRKDEYCLIIGMVDTYIAINKEKSKNNRAKIGDLNTQMRNLKSKLAEITQKSVGI